MTEQTIDLGAALQADGLIQELPKDRITEYLEQRLLAMRVTLLEASTSKALTQVSTDVPPSTRDAQVEAFDKQIASARACIAVLQGALGAGGE